MRASVAILVTFLLTVLLNFPFLLTAQHARPPIQPGINTNSRAWASRKFGNPFLIKHVTHFDESTLNNRTMLKYHIIFDHIAQRGGTSLFPTKERGQRITPDFDFWMKKEPFYNRHTRRKEPFTVLQSKIHAKHYNRLQKDAAAVRERTRDRWEAEQKRTGKLPLHKTDAKYNTLTIKYVMIPENETINLYVRHYKNAAIEVGFGGEELCHFHRPIVDVKPNRTYVGSLNRNDMLTMQRLRGIVFPKNFNALDRSSRYASKQLKKKLECFANEINPDEFLKAMKEIESGNGVGNSSVESTRNCQKTKCG